jgi:hypothetical protein
MLSTGNAVTAWREKYYHFVLKNVAVRKRLCACTDNSSAVTVKRSIDTIFNFSQNFVKYFQNAVKIITLRFGTSSYFTHVDVCFGLLITALLCKFRIDINQLI